MKYRRVVGMGKGRGGTMLRLMMSMLFLVIWTAVTGYIVSHRLHGGDRTKCSERPAEPPSRPAVSRSTNRSDESQINETKLKEIERKLRSEIANKVRLEIKEELEKQEAAALSTSESRRITHRPRISHFFRLAKYNCQKKGKMLVPYKRPTVLEVGAHKGEEWDEMLRYAAHIWSVEPSPDKKSDLILKARNLSGAKFRVLSKSSGSHKEGFNGKLEFFPIALGPSTGFAKFWIDGKDSEQNTLGAPPPWVARKAFADRAIEVKVSTLDEFWENTLKKKHITMLKVDVQGHEPEVIMGGSKLLTEDPPDIIHTEFSPNLMKAADLSGAKFLNFLYDFGYLCFDCEEFGPPPLKPEARGIDVYEKHFGEFRFKDVNHGQWADLVCLI